MNFTNKRILVMGLGRFGGGVGVSRFLAQRGARVLVTDLAPESDLTQSLDKLNDLPIDYRLGEHRTSDFTSADLIVVNPAVDPASNPYLTAARNASIPTTSEIQLLIQHLPNPRNLIAVTGSAGKSTVTTMIHHILAAALGPTHAHVGGNLGGSLLENLDNIQPDHYVVLELSSFMLERLDVDRFSPHIAVVTNIAENHLDRHKTMANYINAKQTIIRHQTENDFAILPLEFDERVAGAEQSDAPDAGVTGNWWLGQSEASPQNESHIQPWQTPAQTTYLTQPTTNYPLLIPGHHNQLNAHFAFTAAKLALPAKTLDHNLLADYHGLPHRLQFITEHNSVRYYNDSKSTTPDAAILALAAFPENTVHLILGGYDKGSDFTHLATIAAQKSAAIYTIGQTGPTIAKLCRQSNPNAIVIESKTLDAALTSARQNATPNQNIVLSPACASFGQFKNYEQRGQTFIDLCK